MLKQLCCVLALMTSAAAFAQSSVPSFSDNDVYQAAKQDHSATQNSDLASQDSAKSEADSESEKRQAEIQTPLTDDQVQASKAGEEAAQSDSVIAE